MDPWTDDTSAISARPFDEKLKSLNLDCCLGNNTLSSLALPSFEFGSSCSRNMENLADKPFMRRLVRKSSDGGNAFARSSTGFASGCAFFFLHNVFDDLTGGTARVSESVEARTNPSGASFAFFFVRKRFISIASLNCSLDLEVGDGQISGFPVVARTLIPLMTTLHFVLIGNRFERQRTLK